jgi:hypothetical protein
MRQPLLTVALLALGACTTEHVPAPVSSLGVSHAPYLGVPGYLTASRESFSDVVPSEAPPAQLSNVDAERLHALLAAIDAHVAAYTAHPSLEDRRALAVTIEELTALFPPDSKSGAQVRELKYFVEELPNKSGDALLRLRDHITELTAQIK